jgi:hypothetical protein
MPKPSEAKLKPVAEAVVSSVDETLRVLRART